MVALQALALYSALVFTPGGSATVTVSSPSSSLTFDINKDNKLLYQEKDLTEVGGKYELQTSGSACASIQVSSSCSSYCHTAHQQLTSMRDRKSVFWVSGPSQNTSEGPHGSRNFTQILYILNKCIFICTLKNTNVQKRIRSHVNNKVLASCSSYQDGWKKTSWISTLFLSKISLRYNIPTPADISDFSVEANVISNCASPTHRPMMTLHLNST